MRVVAYLRVSTDRQAEEGLGLEVQEAAIVAWAATHGHDVIAWCRDEGQSGSNGLATRRGLYDAMGALLDGSAVGLVVYRLDRLARDLVLQESLLSEAWRAGGRVCSTSPSEDAYLAPDGADGDPSRALIRQVLGAVAEYERAMIRLRLRSGKSRKAAKGGYIGGDAPFGYRAEKGELIEDEDEQRVRARIHALRAEGLSLRAVCMALEAEGFEPKRGARWHPQTISNVLRNVGA